MMTEIRSCILSQYLWYSKSIEVDKASVLFLKFFGKKKKKGVNLRENTTYMKVHVLNGYN